MAGLALTGAAALPVAYYTHRHLARLREDEEHPATPGEATLDLAATEAMRLGDRLRGIWDLRLLGADAGLPGLPLEGLELVLDVAPRGLGLIGYLDTPERLRGPQEPRFRLLGDLVGDIRQTKHDATQLTALLHAEFVVAFNPGQHLFSTIQRDNGAARMTVELCRCCRCFRRRQRLLRYARCLLQKLRMLLEVHFHVVHRVTGTGDVIT